MTLQAAQAYANFSIKEGYSSEEDWEGLSDEQLIRKAEKDGNRGDMYADSVSKGEE